MPTKAILYLLILYLGPRNQGKVSLICGGRACGVKAIEALSVLRMFAKKNFTNVNTRLN